MNRPKPLGKLLKVGDTFQVTTKKLSKPGRWNRRTRRNVFEIYRPGHVGEFVKGKRKYICEVLGIVETRTGYYCVEFAGHYDPHYRWYIFTYYVKILEN